VRILTCQKPGTSGSAERGGPDGSAGAKDTTLRNLPLKGRKTLPTRRDSRAARHDRTMK